MYLARVRSTTSAGSGGGADTFDEIWAERAPLGWDPKDLDPTARAVVALLSDWFPSTTGEMLHVDGGLHSTGA